MFEICTSSNLYSKKFIRIEMKPCESKVLSLVQRAPHTLTSLVKNTECSSETVTKHVTEFLKNGTLKEKRTKFSIFYNHLMESEKVDFFEMLLNSTNKLVLLTLLEKKECSQSQLESEIDKSRPSISRSINVLIQSKIVSKNYRPGNKTYFISDKPKIISWLKETHPKLLDRITVNLVEMNM